MSYEGSVQRLCKQGHYSESDAYDDHSSDRCTGLVDGKQCGAEFVWKNSIDDTNLNEFGKINFSHKDKVEVAKYNACPTCGHQVVVSDETYQIPTDEDTTARRTYTDEEGALRYVHSDERV